jgi:hypothetical protein
MRRVLIVLTLLATAWTSALAQSITAVVTTVAPIYVKPGASVPLRTAAIGTVLVVRGEEGEWVEVEFQDPQWGRRVGYVLAANVRVERPETRPMDLSVPGPERVAPPMPAQTPPAIAPAPRAPARGWFDVNIGVAVAAEEETEAIYNDIRYEEVATFATLYRAPLGASFDIGGGYMFTRHLGFGVSVTGTAHEDTADLAISIPHPIFPNRHATDAAETEDKLMRTEGAVHLQLVAGAPLGDSVTLRVFGGPSYFRLEGDGISGVFYDQAWFGTANAVEITSYDTEKFEGTGWGFHVGADLSGYFTRVFGLGAFVRYSRGEVEIEDAALLVNQPWEVKVGGFQAGGGIRLRF